jgi:hypothetical protein
LGENLAAQIVPPLLSTGSEFTVVYGYKADKIISVGSNVSMVVEPRQRRENLG